MDSDLLAAPLRNPASMQGALALSPSEAAVVSSDEEAERLSKAVCMEPREERERLDDDPDAMPRLLEAYDLGNDHAGLLLAQMLLERGSTEEALAVCDGLDFEDAMLQEALLILRSNLLIALEFNAELVEELVQCAMKMGSSEALNKIGVVFGEHEDVAVRFFEKAALAGNATGFLNLAHMIAEKDREASMALLLHVLNGDDDDAKPYAALKLATSIDVYRPDRAKELYELAKMCDEEDFAKQAEVRLEKLLERERLGERKKWNVTSKLAWIGPACLTEQELLAKDESFEVFSMTVKRGVVRHEYVVTCDRELTPQGTLRLGVVKIDYGIPFFERAEARHLDEGEMLFVSRVLGKLPEVNISRLRTLRNALLEIGLWKPYEAIDFEALGVSRRII